MSRQQFISSLGERGIPNVAAGEKDCFLEAPRVFDVTGREKTFSRMQRRPPTTEATDVYCVGGEVLTVCCSFFPPKTKFSRYQSNCARSPLLWEMCWIGFGQPAIVDWTPIVLLGKCLLCVMCPSAWSAGLWVRSRHSHNEKHPPPHSFSDNLA